MTREQWSSALRVGLISLPYFACFLVVVGIPTFVLGGPVALGAAIAIALPLLAAWVICRHGRRPTNGGSAALGVIIPALCMAGTGAIAPGSASAAEAPVAEASLPCSVLYAQDCPLPEDCRDCSWFEKAKVIIACAACFTSEAAFITAAWAAWILPPSPPAPSPVPKIAAVVAAIALYFTTWLTCIECVEAAWECNMIGLRDKGESALQTIEYWRSKLQRWLDEHS